MAKRYTSLSDKLSKLAKEELADASRVRIAKNSYWLNNKEEIFRAVKEGYPYSLVAKAATAEILETGIPRSYIVKTKEGEETTRETKFSASEMKILCESESEK